ncbi:MAG: hypothetical protein Q7S21_00610 [archaeon]|nr:hypothetical protein [archaeon]
MNEKAIYLTIEAIISLLAITALIASQQGAHTNDLSELYEMQKQSDLIRAWISTETLNEEELLSDLELMFPKKKAKIELENSVIEINKEKTFSKAIASKGFYWKNNKLNEIKLTVFY